jgi:hypothetical protein
LRADKLYLCRSARWRDPANKVALRDEAVGRSFETSPTTVKTPQRYDQMIWGVMITPLSFPDEWYDNRNTKKHI